MITLIQFLGIPRHCAENHNCYFFALIQVFSVLHNSFLANSISTVRIQLVQGNRYGGVYK